MNDTIAAISTAPGMGLRSVVRMSGPGALSIAGRIQAGGPDRVRPKKFSAPRIVLTAPGGGRVSARMLVMRAPRSYTTEDVVEFHLVGAPALTELVLRRCLEAGARLARPGEFTRRAYMGGRIDAAQVEGILHLIESRSDEERAAAVHLLHGDASRDARAVRGALVEVLAAIEAYLDFMDEDTEAVGIDDLKSVLRDCLERLERIGRKIGRRIPRTNLPRVVILGPPNAGKSTLFKALVPRARALTSPSPGTTRDLLEGAFRFEGTEVLIYDSPGISRTKDPLERLAVSHLYAMMARMDAALVVLDGAGPPEPAVLREVAGMIGNRPHIHVLNKCDQALHSGWRHVHFSNPPTSVSAMARTGLEDLARSLSACLPPPSGEGGGGVDFQTANTLQRACAALHEAFDQDWEGGLELVAMELREAGEAIGRLSSRVTDEDILNTVFDRFCIGK